MSADQMTLWTMTNGTIINTAAVLVGGLIGLAISGSLPDRYRAYVMNVLGLVTVTLGIDASVLTFSSTAQRMAPLVDDGETYGARMALVMIGSLIIGGGIGTFLRIHDRIEGTGQWIHKFVSSGDGDQGRFAEGFLTASVIFCVGPLALLGCMKNGAEGDPTYLYIKSILDGFCAMALASSLGLGVLASMVTVLLFQGGLSLLAANLPVEPFAMEMMTIVGGIVLLATSLLLLELKKIPVADLLPAIFLPPLIIAGVHAVRPGLLLPA
ncbi:MAG: DUF554 domain-containing protein [Phycisphaerae bacterium]